ATVMGGCSGYAAKKMTKGAALVIGLGFMGLQALSHADVIRINWSKLEQYMVKSLDADGDGKLTKNDVVVGASRIVRNLGSDFPSSAGFVAAFWIGYRYG
ncbi:FUN14 family-domain-containing protein, partial [Gorgonomyces haynaldii]